MDLLESSPGSAQQKPRNSILVSGYYSLSSVPFCPDPGIGAKAWNAGLVGLYAKSLVGPQRQMSRHHRK